MTKAHPDVAYDDALLIVKAFGHTVSSIAYGNILNAKDVADVFVFDDSGRIIPA